jgi:seryl-tRNA synthetase
MLQLRKEMTEQMEESSKGLEKRQENKIATVEKELRAKLNEGEMQMKAVQTELKEEITECRNIADKNVEDLEHSKTLLQNMQAELKKEITCVADACTEALGTTIRAEVSMPVLMCARFCVSLFVHVYLCVSPSLIHNPGHTHTHADTGDSTEFRE